MSLSLPSQLLLQQNLLENTLLMNPPQDELGHEVNPKWTIASFSYAVQQQYSEQGFTIADICQPPAQKFEHIIIYMPKAKARMHYVLDYAVNCLAQDGEIWFVGENKGGIKSLAKNLKSQFAQSEKIAIGKHSAIVSISKPLAVKPFDFASYTHNHENELGLTMQAWPGVFSQENLDKGTAVLLKLLPRKVKGRVLDFGCGAGVIGCYVAKNREIEELEMIDDDILAVKSAQRNIAANDVALTEAFLSNGLSEVKDRYNWIISNPPFHQGVRTDYNVTEEFLTQAKDYLKLSGKLLIVANEFLNYEVTLRMHFKGVVELGRANGFKVIQCEGIIRKRESTDLPNKTNKR